MPVYLDHAATTPMRQEAIAAYADAMAVVGNPSSIHSQGQQARRMLEEARETVAATLGADPIEVVFTSGGTEAIIRVSAAGEIAFTVTPNRASSFAAVLVKPMMPALAAA